MRKKGRNTELIRLRNEKLLKRWYYWTEVERLRLDDALGVLSRNEFFLAEDTIMEIVRKNLHRLSDIIEKPVRVTGERATKKLRLQKTQLCLFAGE